MLRLYLVRAGVYCSDGPVAHTDGSWSFGINASWKSAAAASQLFWRLATAKILTRSAGLLGFWTGMTLPVFQIHGMVAMAKERLIMATMKEIAISQMCASTWSTCLALLFGILFIYRTNHSFDAHEWIR